MWVADEEACRARMLQHIQDLEFTAGDVEPTAVVTHPVLDHLKRADKKSLLEFFLWFIFFHRRPIQSLPIQHWQTNPSKRFYLFLEHLRGVKIFLSLRALFYNMGCEGRVKKIGEEKILSILYSLRKISNLHFTNTFWLKNLAIDFSSENQISKAFFFTYSFLFIFFNQIYCVK